MTVQRTLSDHRGMDQEPDPTELDTALDTATRRVDQAEERLLAEPVTSPKIVPKAERVEHLAEDLHELASDAANVASEDDDSAT